MVGGWLSSALGREKEADILQNFEYAAELERYEAKMKSGHELTDIESSRRDQVEAVLRNAQLRYTQAIRPLPVQLIVSVTVSAKPSAWHLPAACFPDHTPHSMIGPAKDSCAQLSTRPLSMSNIRKGLFGFLSGFDVASVKNYSAISERSVQC
jgi:hypothetical protein